jgi:hypothetical protein
MSVPRPDAPPSAPRAMASPEVRAQRIELLAIPSIQPLATYVDGLRTQGRGEVPYPDPLDGGVDARALFLLEKPGPMTDDTRDGKAGSGFISRDNDDPTAEATFRFQEKAGLNRKDVLLWNLIPWWNGTRKITLSERADGMIALAALTKLLPKLRVIVLVGGQAAKAEKLLRGKGYETLTSPHPSPIVRASHRALWDRIPDEWASVSDFFDLPPRNESAPQ